jgi:glycine/D-amino acid oxidase-like deaminating enzyme
MIEHHADILVLGAGLQGAGAALELARRGHAVTLVEQDPLAVNRASLRNEGKIHLGYIYANDTSRATAFGQLAGALRFRAIIARWVERPEAALVRSTSFHYLVSRDSVVAPDTLAEHYRAVEQQGREWLGADAALDYLGGRILDRSRRLSADELAHWFDPERFAAGFATPELAVDTAALARALRAALAGAPGLTLRTSHGVRTLARRGEGFRAEGDGPDGAWAITARQVVNATWERRLGFDAQLGLAPPADLLHRLKFRVIARVPSAFAEAPSVSMVLGRYGDVVIRPDGTAFLSWYPVGLRGWSNDVEPSRDWDAACRGDLPLEQAREIAAGILAGIDAWYPGLGGSEVLTVDAGAIVAIGRTDVDDAGSGLHDRTQIGVASHDGYHSVDPGKLTTAPRFALVAADRVEAHAAGRDA